jgi:hypothetical protein
MSETGLALARNEREFTILPGGERLEAILAAAAPFPDRVEGEFFEPCSDRDRDLSERVSRWLSEAAADPATTRRVLARRAATGRELGAGLRSVRLRDARRLPEWAQALVAFLEAQPPAAQDDAASARPGGIFEAFRRAGAALLDWSDGTLEGIAVTEAAREDVIRALGVRVWYACEPAIEFELRLREQPADEPAAAVLDVSRDGWLTRFEALPGLAYVIGLACRQWRQSVTEIFSRLRADLPLLSRTLWEGADPGPLAGFTGDAGDRHDDGRAVALLEFGSGRGVVYKPKDLRHTLAFMQAVAFLNERGLPLELQTRTILPRDGYGWEERAVAAPCTDHSGFARFYRRLGMLGRLVQLLEGRDLWADNLLAAGEHPVLTDLECLLYPRVTPPPTLRGARRELLEVFEETVVRTGIVVQPWVPRPTIPIRDLGCLSHAGDPVDGGPSLPLPPYRPWCGDELADPWDYGDEVVAGYREMQAALVANRDELRAPGGPLALFARAQVRYIWRHTWDCQNILRASTSPRALVGGVQREIVLARVLRDAYGMLNGHADRVDLPEIAEAELNAFRQLDVPLFLAHTTSRSPVTQDGREIREHFQGTAWERLQARVDELARFPLDEHLAIVTACLEGVRNGAEIAPPPRPQTAIGEALTPQRLLDVADSVADTLLDARVTAGDRSGWLGLSWYPVPDLYQVEVAGGDLLTGTGAVAVFLAELAARTGSPRHWTAAYEVLDDLVDLVGGSALFMTELRLAGGAPVPGGFAGPGAAIYTLARCATVLADATLLDAARALAAPAAQAARSGRACADVPFGSAGLLLDLLRLRAAAGGDPELDALVRELAADARAALADHAPRFAPCAPTSRLADFVPVGRDSIALALGRALADAPELVDDDAGARAELAAHHYDLGRRGGRLGALDVGAAGPAPQAASTPGALSCRELVATAGEALVAGDRATAERLCRALVDRHDRTGRWFSDRWVDDRLNLSAVDGLVAVGLLALGVLDPELPPLTLLR